VVESEPYFTEFRDSDEDNIDTDDEKIFRDKAVACEAKVAAAVDAEVVSEVVASKTTATEASKAVACEVEADVEDNLEKQIAAHREGTEADVEDNLENKLQHIGRELRLM